uniref:Hematopoietic cell-specific Lyn substrate 1 n=1 Tax=Varanus komodoensis TaxID=61221 RepID=A0A8D2LVT7_VARKO
GTLSLSGPQMWKAAAGHSVSVKAEAQGDDWDTDPDFVNDISEKEQRWGAKTIEGSGRKEHIDIHQLRSKVSEEHEVLKKKEQEQAPRASYGYGGKFGTEKDRMDKSALGHEYVAEVGRHSSQTDAAKGFGGKYGVQKDRADKSALGFEYKGEVEQHASQKDYAFGFGGKFGVQKDRQDRSALGWAHKEEVKPHESQTDHAVGFGGKFGVQKDRQDKSALGWAHKEEVKPHESQTDHAVGFGGKFGVQKDRQDKSALGWAHKEEVKPHESQTGGCRAPGSGRRRGPPLLADYAKGFGGRFGVQKDRVDKVSGAPASAPARKCPREPRARQSCLRRFEDMAKAAEGENQRRAEEERARRLAREQRERQEQQRQVSSPTSSPRPPPRPRGPAELGVPPSHSWLVFQQALKGWRTRSARGACRRWPSMTTREVGHGLASGGASSFPCRPRSLLRGSERWRWRCFGCPPAWPPVCPAPPSRGAAAPGALAQGVVPPAPAHSHSLSAEGDDEISFFPGDTISSIELVDEGWWRGSCHGRFGLFPANYVELLP